MGYTRTFGFRSFENIVRVARFRTPVDAASYEIGTAVTVDEDTPGFLKRPDEGAEPNQLSGLVLFEHIQYQNVDPSLTSPQDPPFHLVPPGRYAQMFHGIGVKVWFKHIGSKTLYDGRTQDNTSLLAGTAIDGDDLAAGLVVGAGLVPDAAGKWVLEGVDEVPWLLVEQVNPATKVVECRFNF